MKRPLNIACLQTSPQPDFESALAQALTLAETAVGVGAQIIALPEYCGGLRTEGTAFAPPATNEKDHPVLEGLREFARNREVWLVVGSIAVTGPAGKIYNRGFVIDDDGAIRSRYDKIHLFDIDLSEKESYRESALVSGGLQAALVTTPFGVLGHTICYDLRFPGLYRDLAQAGADILLVPAAFTKKTGEAHWHILNRARAIENGAFVVAPCAIGPVEGGGESYGHSLIVDPWGEVLADGGDLPGVVHATIDLDRVGETRKRIPSLFNDQPFASSGKSGRDVA
ncbi:MAG: carbon-nitrogen hydrolase family protein [Hyphomicrobiales bacterium]|nr:carbon-nitrogen hydrolase family protein [Hyphomicrobiales bacterium]MCP4997592.1 carbon-nitrogen hydrolase family protein [Hyphomicrobiales bacterium]